MNNRSHIFSIFFLTVLLTACGGGGGGGDSTPGQEAPPSDTTPVVTPPPVPDPDPGTTATLNWTAPTTRVNGDALAANEIAGYEVIYYEENAGQGAGTVVNISNPATTTYTTPELPMGNWYFALSVIDSEGLYSDFAIAGPIALP